MNQVTVALTVFVLVAMVTFGDCQTTINCYACQGVYDPVKGVYDGCDHPFNTTSQQTVSCNGVCVKAISYNPTVGLLTGNNFGSVDTVTRGCTVTSPRLGCYPSAPDSDADATVCVSTCATALCNSADGLRVTAAITVGLLSTLAAVVRRN
jgi:hypothetical protein